MESLEQHVALPSEPVAGAPAWQPEVLESASHTLPADFDLSEVWQWFHARLRARGELSHDSARLSALLNWNDRTIRNALHAARLQYSEWDGEADALRTQLEFTTAEYLAKQVLDEEPIPEPELRPA